jgi:hypothetical protein
MQMRVDDAGQHKPTVQFDHFRFRADVGLGRIVSAYENNRTTGDGNRFRIWLIRGDRMNYTTTKHQVGRLNFET